MGDEGGSFIGRSFVEWASNNNEFKIIFLCSSYKAAPSGG